MFRRVIIILLLLVSAFKLRADAFPLQGEIRSVVILVEFSDLHFTIPNPQEAFTRLLNEKDYRENSSTGSARDFFLACSMGVFQPHFDVYGPYTLDNGCAYYGGHSGNRNDKNAGDMIVEGCRLAEAAGVDFSKYDENNDGVIDNVFVYYAGHNEAEHGGEDTVWPHKSNITSKPQLSGKALFSYSCTSELSGASGAKMCGIGTFCHEFGHVLGLPDMYDTTTNSGGDRYTVGCWDVMCNGAYNNDGNTPPLYSAFERFMLGWLKPQQLTTDSNYVLQPLETHNEAYLIAKGTHNMQTMTPSPYEYFMLENRQRIEWDSVTAKRVIDCALPGEGLLLSHITFDASSWKANTFNNHEVLWYDIVEAINNITTTGGPEDTYPGTAGITSFIPTLNSAERLLDQQVFNISQADNLDILFGYGKYDGSGFSFDKETLRTLTTTFDKGPKEYSTDTVVAVGNKIDSGKITISVYSGNFSFSPDKGKTWYRNDTEFVDTCAADRSYRRELIIRYEPVRQNCDMATGSLQIKSEKSQSKVIALKGTAPRPVYIRQPKITDVRDITPYSFTCSWEDIDDAEQYYLTIYSKTEGKTEIVQSFEGINDSTDIGSGWTYNIAQPSKQECDDGVFSVVLNETGHFIRTPQYLLPITNLSFWFTTHYTEPEEQGMLYLRGFDINDNATLVDSIRLRSTSRYVTKTYDFADKQYQSFVLSYKAVTAKGNVFVDNWRASYDSTLVFVYKDEEREVVAPNHTAIVNSLKPNTKYNIIVQAAEGKGCSTNKTPLANPRLVATLPGTEGKSELSIVCREDESVVVYLPDSGDESRKLFVFTSDGRLVTALDITAGKSSVTIPAYTLQHGQVYFCKYSNAKRMKRKDYHGKFRY